MFIVSAGRAILLRLDSQPAVCRAREPTFFLFIIIIIASYLAGH